MNGEIAMITFLYAYTPPFFIKKHLLLLKKCTWGGVIKFGV